MKEKSTHREITGVEVATIKRILSWPPTMPFPRCPSRSWTKAGKLEEAGEPWHKERGHVCDKCRCDRIAGFATWKNAHIHGDFYGLGEHTGHHGCGYCWYHERNYLARAYPYALASMKAIQMQGEADGPEGQWLRTLDAEAQLSEDRITVREGMDSVKKTLKDFEEACKDGSCTLREYANGVLSPMSDKSRIDLALRISKTLTDITKDVLHMERSDYIHKDHVKIAMFRTIDATLKMLPLDSDRKDWLSRVREIWHNVKSGAK